MRFGTLNAQIDGFWVVAHDSGELAAAVTSYDITGLKGDTDVEYQLILRAISGSTSGTTYIARLNNDSAENYGEQYLRGVDAVASASRSTTRAAITIGYTGAATGRVSLTNTHIFSKSGKERTALGFGVYDITGTTVWGVYKQGFSWNNTADEITSLNILADQTSGLGIGTRIILLKKVHASDGMKLGAARPNQLENAWERIYSKTLSAAVTSITIPNLEGDTDQVYKYILRGVSGYTGPVSFRSTLNSDTTNYGFQYLRGDDSVVSSGRSTATNIQIGYTTTATGRVTASETLLYAKSGYERTALVNVCNDINGTTIGQVDLFGYSWSNTADEITTLTLTGSNANGLGAGTTIELYRLNL